MFTSIDVSLPTTSGCDFASYPQARKCGTSSSMVLVLVCPWKMSATVRRVCMDNACPASPPRRRLVLSGSLAGRAGYRSEQLTAKPPHQIGAQAPLPRDGLALGRGLYHVTRVTPVSVVCRASRWREPQAGGHRTPRIPAPSPSLNTSSPAVTSKPGNRYSCFSLSGRDACR